MGKEQAAQQRQYVVPIQIGIMGSGDRILADMASINVTPNATNMIQCDAFRATIAPEPKRLKLLFCEVGDLFSQAPSQRRLWEKVEKIGSLCPAEAGPYARMLFNKDGQRQHMMLMEPLKNSVFCLFSSGTGRDRKRWLSSCIVDLRVPWDLRMKIIFAEK